MPNILITGGAGFIGSNFAHYYRDHYPDDGLTILDALTYAGNPENLRSLPGVDLIVGSICDTALVENVLKNRNIHTIIHFAAESHVDRSIAAPDAFIETNVVGTHSVLKAARSVWLSGSGRDHRFHHVSTDEVFGTLGLCDPAFSEITPYAPNSPYAASKAAADHIVRAYHHTYGLQVTTTNCSNNYGPYQFPEKLIPLFILNALEGKPLPIYGDGQQIRDWLYVEDHCRGIDLVLKNGDIGECYNIGGGEELTNLTVIEILCQAIDAAFARNPSLAERFPQSPAARGRNTVELKSFVKDRPGHDRRYAIDETKIHRELGYKAQHTFKDWFAKTLDWYLENEQWWRSIRNGSYRQSATNP